MTANLEQEIKEIIANQFNQSIDGIENNHVLAKQYGAKSHDLITLSALIQGKYKIKISYMESHSLKTVEDWINIVKKKMEES